MKLRNKYFVLHDSKIEDVSEAGWAKNASSFRQETAMRITNKNMPRNIMTITILTT